MFQKFYFSVSSFSQKRYTNDHSRSQTAVRRQQGLYEYKNKQKREGTT